MRERENKTDGRRERGTGKKKQRETEREGERLGREGVVLSQYGQAV